MTRTKWIIFGLICVAIVGLVVATNRKEDTSFKGNPTKVITEGPIKDHVYGSQQNKVVLIEYGDFQCPACGSMYPAVKAIKEVYKDELTFVFREFPLTTIHPNALAAATAAEAAGLQEKFYEMHNLLYENQQAWQSAPVANRAKFFEGYAKQLGLDISKYKAGLTNPDVSAKINRDRSTATKNFNFSGTPSFILNGKELPSDTATNGTKLQKAVESALKQAGLPVKQAE